MKNIQTQVFNNIHLWVNVP